MDNGYINNDEIRKKICTQLSQLNISGLVSNCLRYQNNAPEAYIKPCPVFTLEQQTALQSEIRKIGEEEIQKGRLCVLILAGGHGSRLGLPYSKGLINVGITKGLYVF